EVLNGRPAASFCWSTRRTATPPSISGAVSNHVFGPGAKPWRMLNEPPDKDLPSSVPNHSALMFPEPPSVMMIELPDASVPNPTTVPFEVRSLHQRMLRSWFRKHA